MANNNKKLVKGEGVLTFTRGVTVVTGLTKGGSYDDGYEVRHAEYDGKFGNEKGDAIVDTFEPMIQCNYVQIDKDTMALMSGSVVTDNTTYNTITRKTVIEDSDYWDTVEWEFTDRDGKYFKVELQNALVENFSMQFAAKDDIVVAMDIKGNYINGSTTVAPRSFDLEV